VGDDDPALAASFLVSASKIDKTKLEGDTRRFPFGLPRS
jgi:hypothetical protein